MIHPVAGGSAPESDRDLAERLARGGLRGCLAFTGLALVAGLVFLLVGLNQRSEEGVFDQRGVRTEGVILSLEEADRRAFDSPEALVEFTDRRGRRVEAILRLTELGDADLEGARRVALIYDPRAPTQARPVEEWSRPSEEKLVVAGISFLGCLGFGFLSLKLRRRAAGIAAGVVDIDGPARPEQQRSGGVVAEPATEQALPAGATPPIAGEPAPMPAGVSTAGLPWTVRSPLAAIGRGLLVAGGGLTVIAYAATALFLVVGVVSSLDPFAKLDDDGASGAVVAVLVALVAVVGRGLRMALVVRSGGLEVREYRATRELAWEEVEELLIADPPPNRLAGPAVALRTREDVIAPTASGFLRQSARLPLVATLIREATARGIPVSGSVIVAGEVPSSGAGNGAPGAGAVGRGPIGPGFGWRLVHSGWILWTLGFGLTSWIAFANIGVRSGRARWLWAAAVYAVGAAVIGGYAIGQLVTGGQLPSWCVWIGALGMFGVPVVSFVHALAARRDYLRWLAAREDA